MTKVKQFVFIFRLLAVTRPKKLKHKESFLPILGYVCAIISSISLKTGA